jgi:hypothetical protein
MKIITRKIAIAEANQVVENAVKISDFKVLESIAVSAKKHGSSKKAIAQVSISANHIADSPVMLFANNYATKNKRKEEPLSVFRSLIQNSNINIQVMDLETAVTYPYDVYVTLYCK